MDQVDVAVVGGGLLGCATAYYLTRGGASVALLERGELNREASGQNAGSLHFQLEFRMIARGETVASQFALAMPLFLDAQRTWAGLEAELGTPVGAHLAGGLMVAETAAELESLRAQERAREPRGARHAHARRRGCARDRALPVGDRRRGLLVPLRGPRQPASRRSGLCRRRAACGSDDPRTHTRLRARAQRRRLARRDGRRARYCGAPPSSSPPASGAAR